MNTPRRVMFYRHLWRVLSAGAADLPQGNGLCSPAVVRLQRSSSTPTSFSVAAKHKNEQAWLVTDVHASPVLMFFAKVSTEAEYVRLMKGCNNEAPNVTEENQKIRFLPGKGKNKDSLLCLFYAEQIISYSDALCSKRG